MIKTKLFSFISPYLEKYFHNFDKDKLNFKVTSGEVHLNDLGVAHARG